MSAQTTTAAPAPAVSAAAPEVVDASAAATTEKKARRVVDSASVAAAFDALLVLVDGQIASLRAAAAAAPKSGNTGVKFLRTVASRVKQLKKDAVRVMDAPKKRPRAGTTTNGGFLKPHHVTAEMAAFAGWAPDELKSRINITKAICNYVKEKDLYDPNKRRFILPDQKLKDLLQYDPSTAGAEPLTFFYLQKLIGRLQVKDAASTSAPAAPVKA